MIANGPLSEHAERAKKISWLLLDVDGVLTDGSITYTDEGEEIKRFHVRDGSGIKIWTSLGYHVAILSGRTSNAVSKRAQELNISPVLQGHADKWRAYQKFLQEQKLSPESVCAIGDDLPDLAVLANAGLSIAVADACKDLRKIAHLRTETPGGHGAVREAIEWILQQRGRWDKVVESFRLV